jgi:hypothetical protein
MYRLLFAAILLAFTSFKPLDCTYDYLFPLQHGITKFEAKNRMNTMSDYQFYLDVGQQVTYDINKSSCIQLGKYNSIFMYFADDKLYDYTISLRYTLSDYTKMMTVYNEILKTLQQHPIYKFAVPDSAWAADTHELVGVGYKFQKSKIETKEQFEKPDELKIFYQYEKGYNGMPDFYWLTISSFNLTVTNKTIYNYRN